MTVHRPLVAPCACVSICTRCRDGREASRSGRGGERLAAATARLLLSAGMPAVVLRRVECMSLCKRPCAIALSGPGRFTYLFGDLDPECHAAAILDLAARYAVAPQGYLARADDPSRCAARSSAACRRSRPRRPAGWRPTSPTGVPPTACCAPIQSCPPQTRSCAGDRSRDGGRLDRRRPAGRLRRDPARRGPARAAAARALLDLHPRRDASLQEALADRFETLAIDWPGFGVHAKPACDWTPVNFVDFLDHILTAVGPLPALIVAAGHAAGYALRALERRPEAAGRLVLIAPTWRGPFPTMLGRRPAWLGRLRATVDAPALGPVVYAMNLNDIVIRRMARGHVYSDPDWLTPQRHASKRAVAQAPNARFASIRFVTGALDPYENGEPFRSAAQALGDHVLVLWGSETPPKSRAEMEALAAVLPHAPVVLPRGKLGLHEEFPIEVAAAIRRFAAPP